MQLLRLPLLLALNLRFTFWPLYTATGPNLLISFVWISKWPSVFFASVGHLMNTSSCVSMGAPTHPRDLFLKSETQPYYLFDLKIIFNSNTEKWGSVFILKCKVQIPHHLQWHHQCFELRILRSLLSVLWGWTKANKISESKTRGLSSGF